MCTLMFVCSYVMVNILRVKYITGKINNMCYTINFHYIIMFEMWLEKKTDQTVEVVSAITSNKSDTKSISERGYE